MNVHKDVYTTHDILDDLLDQVPVMTILLSDLTSVLRLEECLVCSDVSCKFGSVPYSRLRQMSIMFGNHHLCDEIILTLIITVPDLSPLLRTAPKSL